MFFNTHTSSEVIYLDDDMKNTKLGISVSKSSAANLEILLEINLEIKFFHNALIAY